MKQESVNYTARRALARALYALATLPKGAPYALRLATLASVSFCQTELAFINSRSPFQVRQLRALC